MIKIPNEKITTFATGFATGAISALSLGYLWCRLRCRPKLTVNYTKLITTQSPNTMPAFAANSVNSPKIEM
jgi:hypothetical protein